MDQQTTSELNDVVAERRRAEAALADAAEERRRAEAALADAERRITEATHVLLLGTGQHSSSSSVGPAAAPIIIV